MTLDPTLPIHPQPTRPWLRRLRRIAIRMACWWSFLACVLAGLVAFGTRPDPPVLHAITDVAVASERSQPMAPIQRFPARDGAALAYRSYLPAGVGSPPIVVVMIHGSGGSGRDLNVLGRALAQDGIPAFAPDIRGEGQSGRRGDIDYIGQQEDDLADLTRLVVRRTYPGARLVLVGHSSGGGFALRVAGEPVGRAFSRFVLLSPNLGHLAVSTRPAAGGWVSTYIPRIIGLRILGRLGVHAFDGLPVLGFAVPKVGITSVPTAHWSYRMMMNFGPHGETDLRPGAYKRDVDRAPGPVEVLSGAKDEIFYADRYVQALAGTTPAVKVQVLPGVTHMGLVSQPVAVAAVIAAVKGLSPNAPGA